MNKNFNFLENLTTENSAVVKNELQRLLANTKLEIIPLKNIEGQLEQQATDLPITVTCSPRLGLDHTLKTSKQLSLNGYNVVPHIAAKLVKGKDHLFEIVDCLREINVSDIFIVGGDASQALGPYNTAGNLLQDLAALNHGIENIGIGAYPQGHSAIDDHALLEALQDKQQHATYMATQLCFDPAAIDDWISQISRRGVTLPIYLGIPGVVKLKKLIDIAVRIGAGESLRYLRKQPDLAKTLLRNGSYTPDKFVEAASWMSIHSELEIKGFHMFTFNQVVQTHRWQKDFLNTNRAFSHSRLEQTA